MRPSPIRQTVTVEFDHGTKCRCQWCEIDNQLSGAAPAPPPLRPQPPRPMATKKPRPFTAYSWTWPDPWEGEG